MFFILCVLNSLGPFEQPPNVSIVVFFLSYESSQVFYGEFDDMPIIVIG